MHDCPQRKQAGWMTCCVPCILFTLLIVGGILCFYGLYLLNSSDVFGQSAIGALGYAEQALGNGDVDSALKWADRAIQADPDFYPPYKVRGRVWELKGQYEKAIDDYSKLLSYVSDGYVERGRVYEKLGRLDMAAKDYCRALEDHEVSRNYARFFSMERVFPDYTTDGRAIAHTKAFFAEAIRADPENQDLRECQSRYLEAVRGLGDSELDSGSAPDFGQIDHEPN